MAPASHEPPGQQLMGTHVSVSSQGAAVVVQVVREGWMEVQTVQSLTPLTPPTQFHGFLPAPATLGQQCVTGS